jgi:thiosulfate/3-mercaptopyruvate sulfurtransferase
VDALSAESFAGTDPVTYGPRKGHIRGAASLPMRRLLDEARGTFLPADALAAALGDAGALTAQRTITYCGGGIAATTVAFGLALLGRDNVAIYNNSLMEWSADERLPMEDPSAKGG